MESKAAEATDFSDCAVTTALVPLLCWHTQADALLDALCKTASLGMFHVRWAALGCRLSYAKGHIPESRGEKAQDKMSVLWGFARINRLCDKISKVADEVVYILRGTTLEGGLSEGDTQGEGASSGREYGHIRIREGLIHTIVYSFMRLHSSSKQIIEGPYLLRLDASEIEILDGEIFAHVDFGRGACQRRDSAHLGELVDGLLGSTVRDLRNTEERWMRKERGGACESPK
jgi:hypothetical protein